MIIFCLWPLRESRSRLLNSFSCSRDPPNLRSPTGFAAKLLGWAAEPADQLALRDGSPSPSQTRSGRNSYQFPTRYWTQQPGFLGKSLVKRDA
ncbi:MAG: hypothetical protein ABI180_15100 [Microcoleus sp.]